MNTKLDIKQWTIASLAVFVIMTIFVFVFTKLGIEPWVLPVPQSQPSAVPDAMIGRIAIYLSRLIAAALFTFIFTKAYTEKAGMGHGLRYGLGMGLFLFVPNFISGLVYWDVSAMSQTIYMVVGVIQSVICGAAMAQLYKPVKPAVA
jgi:hypothetical protein